MLDPGRGRSKTDQLWAYARDDRPWGGIDPPMVAFVYAADRKSERAEAHLGDFAGILQVDGYSGYTALAKRSQQLRLAFCWSHVWRKFFDLADKSPVATGALQRIAGLYAIEGEVRGTSAEHRRAVRDEHQPRQRSPRQQRRQTHPVGRRGLKTPVTLFRCPMLVVRAENPGIRSGLMEKKGAIQL